jgi:hypothetical protein
LQHHVPGEQPDHEQGSGAQREVPDAQKLSYAGEPRPGTGGGVVGFDLDDAHDVPAELRRRVLFLRRERQQAGDGAQLVYLALSLGVRREVLLELATLFFRQRAEDVGVLEFVEALVAHRAHLGTATSCESK